MSKSDIEKHLNLIGNADSNITASQIISKHDADENGKLELDEFLKIFDNDRVVKYEKVFETYDSDNDGHLDQEELKKLMATIEELSDDEIRKMFQDADTNNDGQLSFSEFYEICNSRT